MSGRVEAQSDSLVARPLLKLSTGRRASIVGDELPDGVNEALSAVVRITVVRQFGLRALSHRLVRPSGR